MIRSHYEGKQSAVQFGMNRVGDVVEVPVWAVRLQRRTFIVLGKHLVVRLGTGWGLGVRYRENSLEPDGGVQPSANWSLRPPCGGFRQRHNNHAQVCRSEEQRTFLRPHVTHFPWRFLTTQVQTQSGFL